jgi:hypothetical protein
LRGVVASEASIYFDEREFNTLGYRLLGESRLNPKHESAKAALDRLKSPTSA